jgi:hypothetical protein
MFIRYIGDPAGGPGPMETSLGAEGEEPLVFPIKKWVKVPDDHRLVEKLKGNRHFEVSIAPKEDAVEEEEPEDAEEEPEDAEEERVDIFTSMTKQDLSNYAQDEHDVDLNPNKMSRDAILAQVRALEGDENGNDSESES